MTTPQWFFIVVRTITVVFKWQHLQLVKAIKMICSQACLMFPGPHDEMRYQETTGNIFVSHCGHPIQ